MDRKYKYPSDCEKNDIDGNFCGKNGGYRTFYGTVQKNMELCVHMWKWWHAWNYVRKGKLCFLENDIYTCAELVKTYKNRYVKMLVLLQRNKWVPKYAHK